MVLVIANYPGLFTDAGVIQGAAQARKPNIVVTPIGYFPIQTR